MTVHDRRRTTLLALAALMLPVQTLWSQDTTRVQPLTLGDAARARLERHRCAVLGILMESAACGSAADLKRKQKKKRT